MTYEQKRDAAALEYSAYEPKEPLNGLNLIARDQYVGFKSGYDAGHAEGRAEMAQLRAEIREKAIALENACAEIERLKKGDV
jgi:hypothetical protein